MAMLLSVSSSEFMGQTLLAKVQALRIEYAHSCLLRSFIHSINISGMPTIGQALCSVLDITADIE